MKTKRSKLPGVTSGFTDIIFRNRQEPSICYRTGMTVYDEVLHSTRWQGRYFQAAGYIEKESRAKSLQARYDVPMHAFGLQIDGQSLHFGWKLIGIKELPSGPRGQRRAVVKLESEIRPVRVEVHTELDGTPVMKRWLEITNLSEKSAALCELWPWSGVLLEQPSTQQTVNSYTPPEWSLGHFADCRWGAEGDFQWRRIDDGVLRIESRMGKSGHGAPFFMVRDGKSGEIIVGHLAWSGSWGVELTRDFDQATGAARLWFKAGPQSASPMRILDPGEKVSSPAVHLGYLFGDLDDAVQAMHDHLRRSVLRPPIPKRDNLVVYNHWSYTEHELSEESLRHEIDVAAAVGAELFVIDAGWYADKDSNWWDTVGDWKPGNRLPHGFKPIRDHMRRNGLLFGLWVDAERIGTLSKAHKEHPEFLVKKDGQATNSDLDLSKPEAAKWMEEQIIRIVEDYELDLFRLDYNTALWEGGQNSRYGYVENSVWRHMEAVYAVYDRVRRRYPDLILENCAGGGGRTDIGLVSRFDHTWVTDWQIAPRSMRIINGMTMALPPEYVDRNAGVGQDGHRRGDLDFQLRSIIFGHMTLTGIHPLGSNPNPEHLARFKHYTDLYKSFIRPYLRNSRIYHHTPELPGREPSGWGILELASADKTRGMLGCFRLAGTAEDCRRIRLKGVSRGKNYSVKYENSGENSVVGGQALLDDGVLIRLSRPLASELLIVEELP